MTEDEVKQATCQVLSQGEAGTGWLVGPDIVLTAYHCVGIGANGEGEVAVRFSAELSEQPRTANVESFDADLDVCLLRLHENPPWSPLALESSIPTPGSRWQAFGFPAVKLNLGHILHGKVQQALSNPVHGVDLDLSVEDGTNLSSYRGLSGAALIVDETCRGFLRVNIDNSIGAISIRQLEGYLRETGCFPEGEQHISGQEPTVAARPDFDVMLESSILKKRAGYLLIDGAHGIGKSTYCRNFGPESPVIELLGTYAFSGDKRGATPAYQAQPEIFFDWLNSLLSVRATGKPARLSENSYAQLIRRTNEVLQTLAARCAQAGKVGLLFIDGITEAANVSGDGLKRFIDLLPIDIPDGLVIVVTGTGIGAIADRLGRITVGADKFTLPPLGHAAQQELCYSLLKGELASPVRVTSLCELAKGHPLYLRYLVDLVNEGASEVDIAAIPAFSGSIQDYYESIWLQLLSDTNAVNLLGLLARLRWGITVTNLTPILTASESAVLVPTLTRIRHLLSSPDRTDIYHPSFSEFVIHKTQPLGDWIHGRLADFCQLGAARDYGILNKVHHGLMSDHNYRIKAVGECHQQWVDQAVLIGAEPDILLEDIESALTTSTQVGSAVDIVRLLLLSQRLRFRYDTLFAQSAGLVAQALIALGQTDQALRHVLRHGHLITQPSDAFAVVRALITSNHPEEAIELLHKIDGEIVSVLHQHDDKSEFLAAVNYRLHAYSLLKLAGKRAPIFRFFRGIVEDVLMEPRNNFSREEVQRIVQFLIGNMMGSEVCVEGSYRTIKESKLPRGAIADRQHLLALLSGIVQAYQYARAYDLRLPEDKISLMLSDIESVFDSSLPADDRDFSTLDLLIEVSASESLVTSYASEVELNAGEVVLFTKNRALPDEESFDDSYRRLRASYFLRKNRIQPAPRAPSAENWEEDLRTLVLAVAWCDGTARRAKATNDFSGLDEAKLYIRNTILPCLSISLKSRTSWEGSYFIPESTFPNLYARITELCFDCFPGEEQAIFEFVRDNFGGQLGLFSEGFRRSLRAIIGRFLQSDALTGNAADLAFDLLCRWKDYVVKCVQNRHELVPELLHMVPLFARMGSPELAGDTYRAVLSASMGPSWYKEDQLAIMTGVLGALPPDSALPPQAISQIAAYLEQASGEMTFQRYVRADKATFLGELCRRGLYAEAVRYFKSQSCGTAQELFDQASQGDLDRVDKLVGMRFPGGSLEEQSSILQIIENIGRHCAWPLRWALLEVYQQGDARHLSSWGKAFAAIINEIAVNGGDLEWCVVRTRSLVLAMDTEQAWMMLRSLVEALSDLPKANFFQLLQLVRSEVPPERIEQLVHGHGLRGEEQENVEVAIDTSVPEYPEDEDDRLYLPGTFGKRSTVTAANRALSAAQEHVKRRNTSAAVESSIAALFALQKGDWSIWTDNHSVSAAEKIIRDSTSSADELARLYGPLLLAERNVQRWHIAEHLISLVGSKLNVTQQPLMMLTALDHVGAIVGDSPREAFEYLGSIDSQTASSALLELLLWTLDHPNWERRDCAATMILWLLRSSDDWIQQLVNLAITNDSSNRADIVMAALDVLSTEEPITLWKRMESFVDADRVIQVCTHIGRYATLLRILDRASAKGQATADIVAKHLRAGVSTGLTKKEAATPMSKPRFWPDSLNRVWRDLNQLGVLSPKALAEFENELAALCEPLDVPTAYEIERLLNTGFREPSGLPTGRWASKVRCALHRSLFRESSVDDLFGIESVLRTYNPDPLVEPRDARTLIAPLLSSISSGTEDEYRPSDDDSIFLSIQALIMLNGESVFLELVPHLLHRVHKEAEAAQHRTFTSTEAPNPGRSVDLMVCARVNPVVAYFGSLTPAIATPQFLSLLGAAPSSVKRYHWRDGRTAEPGEARRRNEVSLLAMQRESFRLPDGWSMYWTLHVDGQVLALLEEY